MASAIAFLLVFGVQIIESVYLWAYLKAKFRSMEARLPIESGIRTTMELSGQEVHPMVICTKCHSVRLAKAEGVQVGGKPYHGHLLVRVGSISDADKDLVCLNCGEPFHKG